MQIDFGRTIKIVIFAEIIRESCFQQISTLHKLLKFHQRIAQHSAETIH